MRVSPAHAGMNPYTRHPALAVRCLSRARGNEPNGTSYQVVLDESVPHTRECPLDFLLPVRLAYCLSRIRGNDPDVLAGLDTIIMSVPHTRE